MIDEMIAGTGEIERRSVTTRRARVTGSGTASGERMILKGGKREVMGKGRIRRRRFLGINGGRMIKAG